MSFIRNFRNILSTGSFMAITILKKPFMITLSAFRCITIMKRCNSRPGFSSGRNTDFFFDSCRKCTIAITYTDDRFYPDSHNSVLLLRKKAVAEEICYGNMYFIVTDHLRLVRRVYKSPENSKQLRLATSPETADDDRTIERIQIRSMWIVCTVISRML